MHLPANIFFDLGLNVTKNIAQYALHHVAYAPAKFKVAIPTVQEEMHLQEKNYLTFVPDVMVKVARNVAQYPLRLVTYAASKFEIATANGLGDAITRNVTGGHTHARTGGRTSLWYRQYVASPKLFTL